MGLVDPQVRGFHGPRVDVLERKVKMEQKHPPRAVKKNKNKSEDKGCRGVNHSICCSTGDLFGANILTATLKDLKTHDLKHMI